jgi:hypothetical protein
LLNSYISNIIYFTISKFNFFVLKARFNGIMVDFQSEAAITTPDTQITKVLILEKQENVLLAFEKLEQDGEEDDPGQLLILKARINCLRRALRGWYLEVKKPEEYLELVKLSKSTTKDELEQATELMTQFLFDNGLTKINLKKRMTGVIAEEWNAENGL